MTSEDSTLREVDQELAEERQMGLIRQFGPIVAGVAVAIVMGVAGWQIYTGQKEASAEKGAKAYHTALNALEDDRQTGLAALAQVIESEAPGYAALAAMQRAPLLAAEGDTAQAYRLYRSIADNGGVTDAIRDLARLRSAYLSLDLGGRRAVIDDLGTLPQQETPLGYYAREVVALAALGDKDYDAAIQEFQFLAETPGVPLILRSRAGEFAVVAKAGKAGANITGEARVEDLLETLGTVAGPADPVEEDTVPAPLVEPITMPTIDGNAENHDGHDHGDNERGDAVKEPQPEPEL